MTILVVALLVLYGATGNDPMNVAPQQSPDREIFLITGAIALVLGLLTEMWIIYWRFRTDGIRRVAFVLSSGLANTFSAVVVGAFTFGRITS